MGRETKVREEGVELERERDESEEEGQQARDWRIKIGGETNCCI